MIQILDGPDGEQNFETARARAWQSRHKSDYDFHRLAAELTSTSQFEITLEMIHMVSYVKKVAPPGTLNIFPSQFQSAEISGSVSPSSNCTTSSGELKHKRVTKVSQNATKEKLEPGEHIANRSLPGFQTILQCGKTFDCDTLLNKVDSLTFNSPLDADEKVNRIFDKSQSILGKTKASLVDDPRLTEGWKQLIGAIINSFHASNIKHSQVEAKEIPLDDMNAKMNVCMDDTLLLEFLDKNLAGANSEMDTDFAGQCGLNSPTAFVEDMLKKAQKSLNHHKY
ncbi:hypothetical protein KSF78_0007095 [Schistosoma japonicum]|nr:hypothetical protein KSF78_0007095 [Schistosoma japonicum]